MGTVGASAAYLAALGTDHIIAHRTTITASIGVIFQYPEIGDLLTKLGIDFEEIKSGPLKSEPSLFEPASEEARRMIAALVQDSFNYFVDIVAERRELGATLGEALMSLSRTDRLAFLLAAEGLTSVEIAERFSLTSDAVRGRLKRARKLLRAAFLGGQLARLFLGLLHRDRLDLGRRRRVQ